MLKLIYLYVIAVRDAVVPKKKSGTDRRMNFALLRQATLRLVVIIPRLELKKRIIGVELLLGTSVEWSHNFS